MHDETPTTHAPTSLLELSAFDPEARNDPHPRMRALREKGRVMRDEALKTWLLSHYDDIRTTVNDGTFVRQPSPPLARIEARRVYRKLFERYPHMKLAEQTLVWRALPFFRGIEKLEIEV